MEKQVYKTACPKYTNSGALQAHTQMHIGANTHTHSHSYTHTQSSHMQTLIEMLVSAHTHTNTLVICTKTHQISRAAGSKNTSSRNLIEAGRNQRMS